MGDLDLLEPFDRMIEGAFPLARVRAIEAGEPATDLWAEIARSGFLDALLPEAKGGAGLGLADVAPLLQALGRRLVPFAVGDTMFARAMLASAGTKAPEGPIMIGAPRVQTALAPMSDYALVDSAKDVVLVRLADGKPTPTGLPTGILRPLGAIGRAAAIAGAAAEVARMTIAYAETRVQFGKPIAAQQAIQQQIALMAEQVVAARVAAQIGCAHGFPAPAMAAAMAKIVTGNAGVQTAAIAHAVHGAIGISRECDLQLYTRRLYEWRMDHGSEAYWARLLGHHRLEAAGGTSLDFVRTGMAAS